MAETLETANLTRAFGGLMAVSGVSFAARAGQITGLIGPNGAGKTTIFNIISGLLAPTSGQIFFNGTNITGKPPHKVCTLGIGRTFQNLQLFKNMTVLENAMVGLHSRTRGSILESGLRWPSVGKEEAFIRDRAMNCLEMFGLAGAADQMAGSLPFGNQRLVEIARAMATEPNMLLLDEPACGLSSAEIQALQKTIFSIRDKGVSILLVEHNMRLVMGTADHIIVLNYGEKICEGPPEAVQRDALVREAYLGKRT